MDCTFGFSDLPRHAEGIESNGLGKPMH